MFKDAADRLNEARDEKERLQKVVDDSEGVEKQLRELTARRDQREAALVDATERVTTLERLAAQAAALAVADGAGPTRARGGRAHPTDRRGCGRGRTERCRPGRRGEHAGEALQVAQGRLKDAEAAFEAARRRRERLARIRPAPIRSPAEPRAAKSRGGTGIEGCATADRRGDRRAETRGRCGDRRR